MRPRTLAIERAVRSRAARVRRLADRIDELEGHYEERIGDPTMTGFCHWLAERLIDDLDREAALAVSAGVDRVLGQVPA